MTKTTNYQLNQWAKSDRVLMEDFNSDNAKIDAALAAGAKIATGSYTGTGEYGSSHPNTLTFDFEPKVIFFYYGPDHDRGIIMFVRGRTEEFVTGGGRSYTRLYITWSGNSVSWYSNDDEREQMNRTCSDNSPYIYAAIG